MGCSMFAEIIPITTSTGPQARTDLQRERLYTTYVFVDHSRHTRAFRAIEESGFVISMLLPSFLHNHNNSNNSRPAAPAHVAMKQPKHISHIIELYIYAI